MRGKALFKVVITPPKRITPAYAGKRPHILKIHGVLGDHPRVCGEKLANVSTIAEFLGSPPRMRGKGSSYVHNTLIKGITPAYAGKSFCGKDVAVALGDHPRVCGEKLAESVYP